MHKPSRLRQRLIPSDGLPLSAAAVLQGAAVGAGGALTMTMLVGVAAVVGMNLQGLSSETIVQAMQHGVAVRVFVAAAEWLTAIAAGYAAARVAGRRPMGHALWAGRVTIVLKCLTWLLLGTPWSLGMAVVDLIVIVPLALLGGYLASPSCPKPSEAARPSSTRSNG